MKKILMIALLLAVTINAFSQRRRTVRRSYARSSQWYIMPKGGFNIADITDWGGDVRFGLALGGELGCRVNQLITLSGSFIYSQHGITMRKTILACISTTSICPLWCILV